MKRIVILALSVACLSSFSLFAKDSPKLNPFTQSLGSVSAAELPAKAADLVKHAKGRARQATTKDVVIAATRINPAASPAVVGAIAKAVPQMAAYAAGVAAAEQPKLASAIARAAAVAAPAKLGKIVEAVCKAVPNDYKNVATVVSKAVPGSDKAVLKAVSASVPELKPTIDQSISANNAPSVGMALSQSSLGALPAGGSPGISLPRGPTITPPYIPPSSDIRELNPADTGFVPDGGRTYAAP